MLHKIFHFRRKRSSIKIFQQRKFHDLQYTSSMKLTFLPSPHTSSLSFFLSPFLPPLPPSPQLSLGWPLSLSPVSPCLLPSQEECFEHQQGLASSSLFPPLPNQVSRLHLPIGRPGCLATSGRRRQVDQSVASSSAELECACRRRGDVL